MNFQPNDEQRMLCDSARRFFSNEFPLARVRETEANGLSAFLPVYREMGRLGFLGIGVPEEAGGSGDWLDLALFAEEAGRCLLPTLALTSVVLAGQALLACGQLQAVAELASGERIAAPAWLEAAEADREAPPNTRAETTQGGSNIRGAKRFVQGFEVADEVLVIASAEAGVHLARLPRGCAGMEASAEQLSSLDLVHELAFENAHVPGEALIALPWAAWLEALDSTKIVAAAWAVGASRGALDMAITYAKERKQFGRPIGSFQAVQHRLADAAMALEQASAMVHYAAWLRASRNPFQREAAMAKLVAGRAVRQVTHAATLTHGGYGFMEEFDIQLYFRRAKLLDQLIEGPAAQRELLADEAAVDLPRVH